MSRALKPRRQTAGGRVRSLPARGGEPSRYPISGSVIGGEARKLADPTAEWIHDDSPRARLAARMAAAREERRRIAARLRLSRKR